jgi:glutathione synthase/RimK-type ligase-like ATP-grasp enzyme
MRVAFITYDGSVKYSAANGFDEIQGLLPFLQGKGIAIQAEIWDDPNVDWQTYDVALLRMPWDYHQKFDAFNVWLDRMESLGIRLLNDYCIVRWNMDKHYLQEIADAGFDVISSVFLEKNETENISSVFDTLQSDQLIIKPCVSGGSKNTLKIDRETAVDKAGEIATLLQQGAYLAQPFMKEINDGEWSFIFFNNTYSHTILKKPREGDFRVQQFFGGTIDPVYPDQNFIDRASSYLSAFAPDTFYARVDGLMVNGKFMLMELELVEPFLYLAYAANAPENFYDALIKRLDSLS